MTDSPPHDRNIDAGTAPDRPPGTPRWVKLLGILALIAILIVVVVMLVAGGQHGPGRHIPAGGTLDGQAPSANPVVTNAGRAVNEFVLGDAAMQQEHGQISVD